ncbi:unknown [Clostridium sp. CAG:568]|nr:unknown [Clostridium sp. CAG:568]
MKKKQNEKKKISLKELLSQEKPLLEEKKNKEYKELLFKEQDVILEKKNSSLANLMLGLISLIIGGVLLFLSFKYDVTRAKVFNPKSFEFILSCIVLASCLYFLSMAIVGLVSYKTNYRKIRNKIEQSRSLK